MTGETKPGDVHENAPKAVIMDGSTLTVEEISRIARETERYFKADQDPLQGNPTLEDFTKLIAADPTTVVVAKEGDELIAWSFVVPTSKEIADQFLGMQIPEKEMFSRSLEHITYDSVYLMAILIKDEKRGGRLAKQFLLKQILHFRDQHGVKKFFAWTFGKDRADLSQDYGKKLGVEITSVIDKRPEEEKQFPEF